MVSTSSTSRWRERAERDLAEWRSLLEQAERSLAAFKDLSLNGSSGDDRTAQRRQVVLTLQRTVRRAEQAVDHWQRMVGPR